jgi:Protein of unknown function (DUF1360)
VKVLLVCLATWRATHLVVDDDFPPVAWARRLAQRGPGWLGDLVGCRWCASVWLAALVTLLTDLTVGMAHPVLVFAAAAALAPPLAALSDRLHESRTGVAASAAALAELSQAMAAHRARTESRERLADRLPPPPRGEREGG